MSRATVGTGIVKKSVSRAGRLKTSVVILSMHSDEAYVLQALRNGAIGYVLKESSPHDLVMAVKRAVQGRLYLSEPLSDLALEAYLKSAQSAPLDSYDTLTARERQVLHLRAEGRTSSDIAAHLSISPRTVDDHRANMMRKLGLRNQTELLLYAQRRGILPQAENLAEVVYKRPIVE